MRDVERRADGLLLQVVHIVVYKSWGRWGRTELLVAVGEHVGAVVSEGGGGQRDEGGREVCVESEDGDAIARGEGELAVRTERGADVSVGAASHADVSVLLTVLEKVRDQRVGGDVADAPLLHVHHAHRVALCITLSVIVHAPQVNRIMVTT